MTELINISGLITGIENNRLVINPSVECISVLKRYNRKITTTCYIKLSKEYPASDLEAYINKIVATKVHPQKYRFTRDGDTKEGYTFVLKHIT